MDVSRMEKSLLEIKEMLIQREEKGKNEREVNGRVSDVNSLDAHINEIVKNIFYGKKNTHT